MKIFQLTLAIAASVSVAEANYCIQASSTPKSNKREIVKQAKNIINQPHVRVERSGKYLVLRIGDFSSATQAKHALQSIKPLFQDAYVRKCTLGANPIIFQRDNTKQIKAYAIVDAPETEEDLIVQVVEEEPVFHKMKKSEDETKSFTQPRSGGYARFYSCDDCVPPAYD